MGTKDNEPGKLVEKSTIDRNKIKKIYIKGSPKQFLALFGNTKDEIYILGSQNESPAILRGESNLESCPPIQQVIGESNWEFSKTAYDNKYKGIQLELSGRLRGAQRARKMVKKIGSLSQQSFSSNLRFSKRNIYTKWGILGLKVYLNK